MNSLSSRKSYKRTSFPSCASRRGSSKNFFQSPQNQNEAVAISLWEKKEHAEKFNREVYPTVVRLLNKYIGGTPVVKEFESLVAAVPVLHKLAKAVKV